MRLHRNPRAALHSERRAVRGFWQRAAQHDADNEAIARMVAATPAAYPWLVSWAALVLRRTQQQQKAAA